MADTAISENSTAGEADNDKEIARIRAYGMIYVVLGPALIILGIPLLFVFVGFLFVPLGILLLVIGLWFRRNPNAVLERRKQTFKKSLDEAKATLVVAEPIVAVTATKPAPEVQPEFRVTYIGGHPDLPMEERNLEAVLKVAADGLHVAKIRPFWQKPETLFVLPWREVAGVEHQAERTGSEGEKAALLATGLLKNQWLPIMAGMASGEKAEHYYSILLREQEGFQPAIMFRMEGFFQAQKGRDMCATINAARARYGREGRAEP